MEDVPTHLHFTYAYFLCFNHTKRSVGDLLTDGTTGGSLGLGGGGLFLRIRPVCHVLLLMTLSIHVLGSLWFLGGVEFLGKLWMWRGGGDSQQKTIKELEFIFFITINKIDKDCWGCFVCFFLYAFIYIYIAIFVLLIFIYKYSTGESSFQCVYVHCFLCNSIALLDVHLTLFSMYLPYDKLVGFTVLPPL